MRQAVVTRHGPPDVFEIREAADPIPGDGQLRIRVRAAGVNFADVLSRLGLYPDAPQPPCVVGYEVAGHLDATARDVRGFAGGDRVAAMTRCGGYSDTLVVPTTLRDCDQLRDDQRPNSPRAGVVDRTKSTPS